MTTFRDRPSYHLTRHFFDGLFDLGFLSDAGTMSFTRMIIGICAVFFSIGLLLVRVFAAKYAALITQDTPEPYRQALLSDHAFLIAIPMWIVGFVTVLVGHSLFPDELDYRVLMALPVTRRLVFATKLLALALFVGLFIGTAHAALVPLFLLTSFGRWVERAFVLRALAYEGASLLASGFVVFAVMAVQGLVVLFVPRGRFLTVSAALRSAMLGVLVVLLPLVGRLPARAEAFASESAWLYLAPPAWFVGVERLLLGDGRRYLIHHAEVGLFAAVLAVGVAIGSYAVLYRRFDRVLLRPAHGRSTSGRPTSGRQMWGVSADSSFTAVRTFTSITLRRSILHQGMLVALSAVGLGVVINTLIGADLTGWFERGGTPPRGLVPAVMWAPFALIFVASLAVRAALVVPIELRANWVFRMTEDGAPRVPQLRAALSTVRRFGIVVPILVMLPLQWLVLGERALVPSAVTWLCGWLLVEILMKDWARIPFTSSYIPGKGFIPQTILTGLVSFVAFTTFGFALAQLAVLAFPFSGALIAILIGVVLVLRRRRLQLWRNTPLAFDDQLPTEIHPLRLTRD